MGRKLLALALGIPALVILVGAIGQLVLPPLTAGRMEDRLTEGGGSAMVSTEAFPAARLLFGDGDRIEVRGSGLDLELAEESDAFERLDEFDDVDVRLDASRAGPLEVDSFELSRSGSAPYRLASTARSMSDSTVRRSTAASGARRVEASAASLSLSRASRRSSTPRSRSQSAS